MYQPRRARSVSNGKLLHSISKFLSSLVQKQKTERLLTLPLRRTAIIDWCAKRRECLSDTDQHAFKLISIVSRIVSLCSKFKNRYNCEEEAIFDKLNALDLELEMWALAAPEGWEFLVERTEEAQDDDKVNCHIANTMQHHIYRDLW
jgi:hypothetical protein